MAKLRDPKLIRRQYIGITLLIVGILLTAFSFRVGNSIVEIIGGLMIIASIILFLTGKSATSNQK
jgi:hypothetical protein